MYKWVKLALVVSVLLLAFIAAVHLTSTLKADMTSVKVESAQSRQSDFDSLYAAVERGDLAGNQFKTSMSSGDASKYCFITYTADLSSMCFLPSEWAIMNISPLPGDVAIVQGAPQDVPAMGKRTITATLLTESEYAQQDRTLWAEYYVFGRLHSSPIRQAAK